MKKTLSVLLALLLAVLCVSISAFASSDEEETAPDAHSVSLFGCNEPVGSFTLDTENQLSGSGCITYRFAGSTGAIVAPYLFPEPLDLTLYDTIEFDMYVSDVAFFSLQFQELQLELTSSGTSDREELAFRISDIVPGISGEPKTGWNHVAIPFESGSISGSEPDFKEIDYMRFYTNHVVYPDEGITVRFDNFRATDALYGKAAEEWGKFEPLCKALEEKISAYTMPELTADNHKEVRAALDGFKAEYEALPAEAQNIFNSDLYGKLFDLTSQVVLFELNLGKETKPAATEAPAVTDAPAATNAPETKAPETKKGCGSTVPVLALMVILAAAPVAAKKRG